MDELVGRKAAPRPCNARAQVAVEVDPPSRPEPDAAMVVVDELAVALEPAHVDGDIDRRPVGRHRHQHRVGSPDPGKPQTVRTEREILLSHVLELDLGLVSTCLIDCTF